MKTNFNIIGIIIFTIITIIACQPETVTTTTTTTTTTVTAPNEELMKLHSEYEDVEAAILDYVEGIYEVDSTRIERSIHPELRKRGYWYSLEKEKYYDNLDMTFKELVHLAATWNAKGNRADENSPKKIDIYDINDRTASAKLTAAWGIDYFHLAKLDGKWYIMNVLWQSIPE